MPTRPSARSSSACCRRSGAPPTGSTRRSTRRPKPASLLTAGTDRDGGHGRAGRRGPGPLGAPRPRRGPPRATSKRGAHRGRARHRARDRRHGTTGTGRGASVRLNLVNHLAGDVEREASAAGADPGPHRRCAGMGRAQPRSGGRGRAALAQGRFDDVERLGAMSERSVDRSAYTWSAAIAVAGGGPRPESCEAMARAHARPSTRWVRAPAWRPSTGWPSTSSSATPTRAARAVAARPWRPAPPAATLLTLPSLVLHAEIGAATRSPRWPSAAMVPLRDVHQRGVVLSQGWTVLLSRLVADCLVVIGEHRGGERGWRSQPTRRRREA